MNESMIFNEFLSKNPFPGKPYDNVSFKPNRFGSKTRFFVPEWLSNEPDRYLPPSKLTLILRKFNYTIQMYYDILVLGLTNIEDRPKCPITGEYTKFYSITLGYRKYSSIQAFSKSLSLDTPENRARNAKISKAKMGNQITKGRKITEETRKRMSMAQKGHYVSDEAKRHMSESHVGKPGSRKGIPHSKEVRDRLSKLTLERIDKNPEIIENFIKYGIQKTNKGYYKSDKYVGNNITGKWFYYMSNFEAVVLELCDKLDTVSYIDKCPIIKYEFNGKGKRYLPDILVKFTTGETVILELKPKYRTKDEIVIAKKLSALEYCKLNGFYYSIITEDEIKLIKENKFDLLEFIKNGVKY